MTTLAPSDWLQALEAELDGLARGTLGLPAVAVTRRCDAPPAAMEGAYLGLVSGQGSYQIGLAATAEGCQAFARGLLAVDGSADPLPAEDVADAVCEIVIMLAGGVQRRVRERSGLQVGLGLPTFFHGPVQPTERLGVAVAEVRVGALPAALLVLHPRARGEES